MFEAYSVLSLRSSSSSLHGRRQTCFTGAVDPKLYNDRLSKWQRHLVMVKPGLVALFDDVASAPNTPAKVTSLLHAKGSAASTFSVNGETVTCSDSSLVLGPNDVCGLPCTEDEHCPDFAVGPAHPGCNTSTGQCE
jgi:hypothetical protein